MPTRPLSEDLLKQAVEAYIKCNRNKVQAARSLNLPQSTYRSRLSEARRRGFFPEMLCADNCSLIQSLDKSNQELRAEIQRLRNEKLSDDEVKRYLLGIKDVKPTIPEWTTTVKREDTGLGIPTLLLSDFHWAEVVAPEQVDYINEYNLEIARSRLRTLVENVKDLCHGHLKCIGRVPGLVLLLNGDFLSGTIHDDLIATNEVNIMPSFVDIFGSLLWLIKQMEELFRNVTVYCTRGNHTRTTKRRLSKGVAYTSFDWLLYQQLAKWFDGNTNVVFQISDGEDIHFKIYNHRYCMTHGDQFRGGTGFIGAFAPITRGELKKRGAASTYGRDYDTLVIGHFHQVMYLNRVVVNGSLVGYSEFAMTHNIPFEEPQQAFWFTHPERGLTIKTSIFCKSIDVPG